jgi:hypothetical protein
MVWCYLLKNSLVTIQLNEIDPLAETWPSGRRRSPAKGVTG